MVIILASLGSLIGYVQHLRHSNEVKSLEIKNAAAEKVRLDGIITTMDLVISDQADEMKTLRAVRELDSKVMTELAKESQKLNVAQFNRSQSRTQLGKQNAEVKSFLDTPVPPDLRRLRDKQIAKYRSAGETRPVVPADGTDGKPGAAKPGAGELH